MSNHIDATRKEYEKPLAAQDWRVEERQVEQFNADFCPGKFSTAFICTAVLSDSFIEAIWQQTRVMYGR